MTPLRFQRGQRDIYGMLTLPAGGAAPMHGVVFCNPLGQEAIRTHRMYRVLADRLNAAGFAVLRFDYYATGDSAGAGSEADLHGWVDDILAACDLLRLHSGCERLSLFGMRLGANLALRAAAQLASSPEAVLLWEPIVDGTAYLQQLQQAHSAALANAYGARWVTDPRLRELQMPAASAEILGFVLSAGLKLGLDCTRLSEDLAQAEALLPRLHLWCEPLLALRAPFANLQSRPPGIRIDWTADEALNTPIAPVEIVRGVLEALGDHVVR